MKPAAAASAGFLHEESVQAAAALDSVEVDAIAYLGLPSALAAGAFGDAAATDLLDATLFRIWGSLLLLRLICLTRRGLPPLSWGTMVVFRLTSRVRSLQRATEYW